jgi:hypothetical protein
MALATLSRGKVVDMLLKLVGCSMEAVSKLLQGLNRAARCSVSSADVTSSSQRLNQFSPV